MRLPPLARLLLVRHRYSTVCTFSAGFTNAWLVDSCRGHDDALGSSGNEAASAPCVLVAQPSAKFDDERSLPGSRLDYCMYVEYYCTVRLLLLGYEGAALKHSLARRFLCLLPIVC
jgi:hypothetical protein